MIHLNIQTVEELIFYDKKVQQLLPEFNHHFNQWKLGTLHPSLRSLGKRALLDFLNELKEEHREILTKYFDSPITLDKLDYHTVQNLVVKLDEAEGSLCKLEGYPYFSVSRDQNTLYVCSWR